MTKDSNVNQADVTDADIHAFKQLVAKDKGLHGDPVWNVGYRLCALIREQNHTHRQEAIAPYVEALREASETFNRVEYATAIDLEDAGRTKATIDNLLESKQ